MSIEDHVNFISTGSGNVAKAFRQAEAKLLSSGKFMEAFDLNANAIKKQFGPKYDKSIIQAREYYVKNVVPLLQKQL